MNPLGRLVGASPYVRAIKAGLWVAALVAVAVGVWRIHHSIWQSGWDARDTQATADAQTVLVAHQRQALALAKQRDEQRDRADQVQADLVVTRQLAQQFYDQLHRRIPDVARSRFVPQVSSAVAPAAVCDCGFSAGFVGLWNSALAGPAAVPAGAGDSAGVADPPAAAGAVDAAAEVVDVDQRDILDNHVANAERCSDVAAQLNALISLLAP